jgi:hypothetical protein
MNVDDLISRRVLISATGNSDEALKIYERYGNGRRSGAVCCPRNRKRIRQLCLPLKKKTNAEG